MMATQVVVRPVNRFGARWPFVVVAVPTKGRAVILAKCADHAMALLAADAFRKAYETAEGEGAA